MALFHPEVYLANPGVVAPDIAMNKTDSERTFGTVQVGKLTYNTVDTNCHKNLLSHAKYQIWAGFLLAETYFCCRKIGRNS